MTGREGGERREAGGVRAAKRREGEASSGRGRGGEKERRGAEAQ